MRPIEDYLQQAEALAQDVVNAWGISVQAGNGELLSDEFKDVLDKACRFRTIKRLAENHREFGILAEMVAAEETTTRRAFAETYRSWAQNLLVPQPSLYSREGANI
jgi:hypothetical protein